MKSLYSNWTGIIAAFVFLAGLADAHARYAPILVELDFTAANIDIEYNDGASETSPYVLELQAAAGGDRVQDHCILQARTSNQAQLSCSEQTVQFTIKQNRQLHQLLAYLLNVLTANGLKLLGPCSLQNFRAPLLYCVLGTSTD